VRTCTPEGLEAVYRGLDNSDRCTLVRLSCPVQEVDEACLQLHRGELDTGVLVKRRTSGMDVVIHK